MSGGGGLGQSFGKGASLSDFYPAAALSARAHPPETCSCGVCSELRRGKIKIEPSVLRTGRKIRNA